MTSIESNTTHNREEPRLPVPALIEQSSKVYDEDMLARRVYHLSESVSLFFRGREERVALSGDNDVVRVTLGDSPNWLLKQDEKLDLGKFDPTAGKIEISVSKTLKGVLETALLLKPDNKEASEMLREVSSGIMSDKILKIIDTLIAANVVTDKGTMKVRNEDLMMRVQEAPHAEMLMALALNGDSEAQAILDSKYKSFIASRSSTSASVPERRGGEGELKVEDLLCVHTTAYRPEINAKGDALIKTTNEATSGKFLRNTVHTALNHKVASHVFGNWEDSKYTVISSFVDVMEANGKPTMLNTVDTWWSISPGQRMIFPRAQIVAAGSSDQSALLEVDGNVTKFKTGNFNYGDLRELAPYFSRYSDEKVRFVADTATEDDGVILPDDLAKQVSRRVHDYAVNRVIKEMGFDVQQGGMWSWNNDVDVTIRSANLANSLSVGHGNHTDSLESSLERCWAKAVSSAIDTDVSSDYVVESGKIKLPRISEEHIKSASLSTLRAVYQVGGFFGRV
jgi:hypothetical protein